MRCTRAAYPHLAAASWGSVIVNIASTTATKVDVPGISAYASSKAGILALTKLMAFEFAAAISVRSSSRPPASSLLARQRSSVTSTPR